MPLLTCFTILLLCCFQLQSEETLRKIASLEESALTFSPEEMFLPPLEDYLSAAGDNADEKVIFALRRYHSTKPYAIAPEQFARDPDEYFNRRLVALEKLLCAVETTTQHLSYAALLQKRAQNKRDYINALPPIDSPWATKAGALSVIAKSLPLRDHYIFEKIDPLHRVGKASRLRQELWELSHIPNYFIFLETIEGDPLLEKYAPEHARVAYLTDAGERAPHRLSFVDGKIYHSGVPFDTSSFKTLFSGEGVAIFVLGEDGEFYVNNHIKDQLHHSTEFAGQPVLCAGEIVAKEGELIFLSNKSGHYAPSYIDLLYGLKLLEDRKISLEKVILEVIFAAKGSEARGFYNAKEFLDSKGETLALPNRGNNSPLHLAVWLNQWSLADRVVTSCNLNGKNAAGETALHLAVRAKLIPWVDLLLAHHAHPSLPSKTGWTPLHRAAAIGDIDLVKKLYLYCDGEKRTKKGETPLLLAARSGNLETLSFLLEKGRSPSAVDNNGNGLLAYAALSRNHSLLRKLLKCSPRDELTSVNRYGANPLHTAAAASTAEIIALLIDNGFDPYAVDCIGNTLMHYAATNSNGKALQYLIDQGFAEMARRKNLRGETPLHLAAGRTDQKSLLKLLEVIENCNPRDDEGNTPLIHAIKGNKDLNILALASSGVDFHLFNKAGRAAIHEALHGEEKLLLSLLTQSDDIGLKDAEGNLPLHLALKCGKSKTASFLISFSEPKHILHTNNDGLNAIDIAQRLGYQRLASQLEAIITKE